jgi:hypothetical protein
MYRYILYPVFGKVGSFFFCCVIQGLKQSFKQDDKMSWTGLIWLRAGTCDGDQKFQPNPIKIKPLRFSCVPPGVTLQYSAFASCGFLLKLRSGQLCLCS